MILLKKPFAEKEESKFYRLLNGEWNFRYFESENDIPKIIEEWDKVPVPSCWQLLGYENLAMKKARNISLFISKVREAMTTLIYCIVAL